MSKKIIQLLSLLVLVLFVSCSTQMAISDVNMVNQYTVTWHSSVEDGAVFKWKLDFENWDPSSPPTLGGYTFGSESIFEIRITQVPSTFYGDLYSNTSHLFDYYLDGNLLNLELSLLETESLYPFILPLTITSQNATSISLQDFLTIFEPISFSQISVQQQTPEEFILVWERIGYSVTSLIDQTTGIANQVHFVQSTNVTVGHWVWTLFEEPSNGEEPPDSEESDYPVSIGWSDVVTKGITLAWNVTTFSQPAGVEPFTIGTATVSLGDIFQFGYVKDPPSNPQLLFDPPGPPDWLQLWINANEVPINTIGSEGEMLLWFVIPLEFTFENGSVLGLRDFFDSFIGNTDKYTDYSLTEVNNTYYDVTWREEWDDEGETGFANYNLVCTKATGIAVKFEVIASEGHITWEYFEEAATVDPEEAETKTIKSEYSRSLRYPVRTSPSVGILGFILAFGLCLVIYRRMKH